MSIIRVSTNGKVTIHEIPNEAYLEFNEELYSLVGNGCGFLEHVMPKRLYKELRHSNDPYTGKGISMLVDEEGCLKPNEMNVIASWLYETDKHNMPIMGNVLFVGETFKDNGICFCGLDNEVEKQLYTQLTELTKKIRKEDF